MGVSAIFIGKIWGTKRGAELHAHWGVGSGDECAANGRALTCNCARERTVTALLPLFYRQCWEIKDMFSEHGKERTLNTHLLYIVL